MLGYPEVWDRGGGSPLPLENSEAHLSLVRLKHESPKWVFGFVESIEPKLRYGDEILKIPFRPLEPLKPLDLGDPGALYPFNPWTLEP